MESGSRADLSRQIREMVAAWNDAPASDHRGMGFGSPADVAVYLQATLRDLEQEEFHVLLLNTKNEVIRDVRLYQGTVKEAPVRVAEVFREAIRDNATSIVIAHNHPSGSPTPSVADVGMTRKLVAAGRLLEIEVLDHIVVGRDCYASLRERKLGFETPSDGRAE